MIQESDVKGQAKDILDETLDREAVLVLTRISEEMQLLFIAHPDPTAAKVKEIVAGFFLENGKSEQFIDDWIKTSEDYGQLRGLSEHDQPKAMLSDFGVFRFMSFLKDKGLTDDQITIVLTGAVQQASEQQDSAQG